MLQDKKKTALCQWVKAEHAGFAILLAEPPPVYLPYITHS